MENALRGCGTALSAVPNGCHAPGDAGCGGGISTARGGRTRQNSGGCLQQPNAVPALQLGAEHHRRAQRQYAESNDDARQLPNFDRIKAKLAELK